MPDYELRSDFAREVLDESGRVPVLVDFWAPWCGPCRILSPILEKLVREAAGTWKLVTVDTDQNPDLAEVLRIRSIPTVFLFSAGKPIATFSGALPEKDVREWLRTHLPAGAPGPGDEEGTAGDDQVDDVASRIRTARMLFAEDPGKAAEVAAGIPEESEHREIALHFARLCDLILWADGKQPARAIAGPEADTALYREGVRDMAAGRYAEAIEKWLGLVGRNRELDEDGARKALVALLAVLGEEDPLTREARRRLASALF